MTSLSLDTPIEAPVEFSLSYLTDLRQRVVAGEEIPAEEYRIVLEQIRRARSAAPAAGKRGRAPRPSGAAVPDMLSEL